jgi:hypothetical protein
MQLVLAGRGTVELTEVIVLSVSMFFQTVSVNLSSGGVRSP